MHFQYIKVGSKARPDIFAFINTSFTLSEIYIAQKTLELAEKNYIENEKVKWSISNNTSSDTKISDAGYLTITKDENSKKYSLQRKRQMDIKTQLQ